MTTPNTTLRADSGGLPSWFMCVADNRWLCFAIGAAASFFAVGGRWDIALAAWVAPVFLLRFARASRPLIGLSVLLLLSTANALWWSAQFAVPLSSLNIVFNALLGLLFTLPYVVDRLVASRLGTAWKFVLFPATIAACEFAVGTLSPLGATYGLRAVTQSDNLALLQVISLTGPYGIGFLIGWFATTLNNILEGSDVDESPKVGHKSTGLPVGLFAGVLLIVLAGGGARLVFERPGVDATYVRIAGITPDKNLRDSVKKMFDPGGIDGASLTNGKLSELEMNKLRAAYAMVDDELFKSTHQAAKAGAQIVLWSETAATTSSADKSALLKRGAEIAREEKIYLNLANGEPFARNETELIDPQGQILWSYQKNHPVPGMEPVPPGNTPVPVVNTAFGKLSNAICYDADFPALLRVQADIMLVPGWDWPEIGPSHTLKMPGCVLLKTATPWYVKPMTVSQPRSTIWATFWPPKSPLVVQAM